MNPSIQKHPCETCGGEGERRWPEPEAVGISQECTRCEGGYRYTKACPAAPCRATDTRRVRPVTTPQRCPGGCKGTGRIPATRKEYESEQIGLR